MQVSTTHVVPEYVHAAFNILQREHLLFEEESTSVPISPNCPVHHARPQYYRTWNSADHLNADGSWKRLQASPEQRQRQQVAIMNQPMPMEQSEQRQAIEAQVQSDLDRIFGNDNTFHEELEKTMHAEEAIEAPLELIDGISPPRKAVEVKPIPTEHPVLGTGVWEPRKVMVEAKSYHVAPENFRMDENHRAVIDDVDTRRKVLPFSLVQWLDMLNKMPNEQAALECVAEEGARLLETVKSYLFHTNGVQAAVADELEILGYQVSYSRIHGTLLLEMRSGAIRWSAV